MSTILTKHINIDNEKDLGIIINEAIVTCILNRQDIKLVNNGKDIYPIAYDGLLDCVIGRQYKL